MVSKMLYMEDAIKSIRSKSNVKRDQAESNLIAQRQKTVSYQSNTQYLHGANGLLSQPGLDQDVLHTIYQPMGISHLLPFRSNVYMNPIFDILTQLTGESGSEPNDECSAPPKTGQLKEAALTAPFGKIIRETEVIVKNRLGQVRDRGEPMDLRLVNDLAIMSPWTPDPARNADVIGSEVGQHLWKLGMTFARKVEPLVFTGNPTNNVGTGYAEFNGFDLLINTGKIDVLTGTLVPALDSLLVDWNNALVSGSITIDGVPGNDIVTTLSAMHKYLKAKAKALGLDPTEWVLAMRFDLFWELTKLWPCSYLTNGCQVTDASGQRVMVTGAEQVAMRDSMRGEGSEFLWINGERIPVVITDGNDETVTAGVLNSDIYWIPMRAGGFVTSYFDYFDQNNSQEAAIDQYLPPNTFNTSNSGLYLWTFERDGYCLKLKAKMQNRLVLRTPFLAARLQNVGYKAILHTFDSSTSGLYAAPGGGSTVKGYAPTALYPTAV